jgi:hypothetical protein
MIIARGEAKEIEKMDLMEFTAAADNGLFTRTMVALWCK